MHIANLALKALALKAKAFENSTRDPVKAQEKILLEYLTRNKDTEYGRKYNFSGIRSIKDYQARVPMVDYEAIRPYIDRMAKGENNIITKDETIFFGITSGTTGIPKLMPVTKYSKDKKESLMRLWAYYISKNHPRVFAGNILAIISPEVKSFTNAGIPYGPEDGHEYNNLPFFIKGLYVLPYPLFYIKDYDARYYSILRISMEKDIRSIATLNPSSIVLLCQRIESVQGDIIKDIENGTLKKDLKIELDIRKIIEKGLRPNPKRAGELRKILEDGKPLIPKYFWPQMDLVECWKGGTVKLYLKDLPQYLGNISVRDFGCLSTETRSSIPLNDIGAGSVLAISTNFYEFVPRGDMDKEEKRFLLANQLEEGMEYYIIVTTPGGLYRYNIDDVIRVDGFYNRTPVIEFVQKGMHAVSLTGEKIYESHINEAVNRAVDKTKISIRFFCASVQLGKPDYYIFLIEFNGNLSQEEKKNLLRCIEEELCAQNSEYRDIREQQILGHPMLKVVKNGEFAKYRSKKIGEGRHDGQFKMPELVGDFNFYKNFAIEEEIRAE